MPFSWSREQHLAWAKKRALEYCARGEMFEAWFSLVSDLQKHEETTGHPAIRLGAELLENKHLQKSEEIRKFIEDFG